MKLRHSFAIVLAFFFAAAVSASAQTFATWSVTVTNLPNDGDTIILDGTARTWKTTVTVPATQILIGANTNTTATNLYQQLIGTPISGRIVGFITPDVVTYEGVSATVSETGVWGSITSTSGTDTPAGPLNLPATSMPAATATNLSSLTVVAINTFDTNAFATNTPAMALFADLFNAQTLSNKTLIASTNISPVITNALITNATEISGNVASFTNGNWRNPTFTNAQNFGNPFRSPGAGTGSEQFGLLATAGASSASAFGDSAKATQVSATAIGANAFASNSADSSFGAQSTAMGPQAVAIGNQATATGADATAVGTVTFTQAPGTTAIGAFTECDADNSTALGFQALAHHTNSTAIGQNSSTTTTNQIVLGTANGSVYIPGVAQLDGGLSNLLTLTTSTNVLNGATLFPHGSISVVNGNNTIDPGTNTYIILTGATSAFTVASIKRGVDGRVLQVQNSTGQLMTSANNSGFDGTAANHIFNTPAGAGPDTNIVNGMARYIYDGSQSRWVFAGQN